MLSFLCGDKKGMIEMIEFVNINVNPKNRKTGDCSTRTIVGTLGISYENALNLQLEASKQLLYGFTCKETIEAVLAKFGYVKVKQPKRANGLKYKVGELDELLTKEQMNQGVCVLVSNHFTCITNGKVQDIWDCRGKTVLNYFVKVKDVVPPYEKEPNPKVFVGKPKKRLL